MTRTTGTATATALLRGAGRRQPWALIERMFLTRTFQATREIARRAMNAGGTMIGTIGGMTVTEAVVPAWTMTAVAVLAGRGVAAGRRCATGITTEIETCTGDDELAWRGKNSGHRYPPE